MVDSRKPTGTTHCCDGYVNMKGAHTHSLNTCTRSHALCQKAAEGGVQEVGGYTHATVFRTLQSQGILLHLRTCTE